jgi:hypothetical protein
MADSARREQEAGAESPREPELTPQEGIQLRPQDTIRSRPQSSLVSSSGHICAP